MKHMDVLLVSSRALTLAHSVVQVLKKQLLGNMQQQCVSNIDPQHQHKAQQHPLDSE